MYDILESYIIIQLIVVLIVNRLNGHQYKIDEYKRMLVVMEMYL